MEQIGKRRPGSDVIPTPIWVMVVRIFQVVLSFVVLGCCGAFVHWLYSDQLGFAIICSLFTWIISIYNIIAEKVPACRRAYNVYATLALDVLMIIFWLASLGALAAYRATFNTPVNASCSSNGSLVDSGECVISKRARGGTSVATKGALNLVSGAAGVSALIMLLYIVSFAYVCHFWRISRARGASGDSEKFNGEMASGIPPQQVSAQQSQSLLNQPSGYQADAHGYAQSHQAPGQYHSPQDLYTQQTQYSQHGTTPYDPYSNQKIDTHYSGASAGYGGHDVSNQHQPVAYSTPTPGQMYQPPPQ
ncbi:uncharacterized protein B0I36DRAFT_359663 [Microdochium trichocladiopsis]|uniref:MARVEL domain-containing protein n=1 Tax=Microdochium trichocladiopsis TaxID=1682393 RepID=A0A9P9BUW3_9PEZI|nr:uncharacterized protein B0I36DRAFT_359663 [Microdochium trichocladiopsis]KAH7038051.1 hypothetical protein B0I36DRAFT_359663 [Microdochium trichocladiopsis]